MPKSTMAFVDCSNKSNNSINQSDPICRLLHVLSLSLSIALLLAISQFPLMTTMTAAAAAADLKK